MARKNTSQGGEAATNRNAMAGLESEQARFGRHDADPATPAVEHDSRSGVGGVIVKGLATDPPHEDVPIKQHGVGEPG